MELPPGFERRVAGPSVLVVESSLAPCAEALGLLEPDGLARLGAAPSGGSGRAATALVALPASSERLVVRRVLHGGLLGPLWGDALLGLGRPLAELRVTARLRERGAPVPRPAFVLGQRRAGPLFRAALATRFEEDARDAQSFLCAEPERARLLRAARAAGEAVRRFHDLGGSHRDLHVKNLLIREMPERTECIIVDLDRARLLASVSAARRMAELMRLFRSLRKRDLLARVGPRGVACFFQSYVGGDRSFRAQLRAHLGRERVRMALHAWRYRERRRGPAAIRRGPAA